MYLLLSSETKLGGFGIIDMYLRGDVLGVVFVGRVLFEEEDGVAGDIDVVSFLLLTLLMTKTPLTRWMFSDST